MATFVRKNSGGTTTANFNYGYAPTGERVTKTDVGGQAQAFMYDGPDVVADYTVPTQGSFSLVQTYLGDLSIDTRLCTIAPNGGVFGYFNTDALGSVHQLLDQPILDQQPQVITGSTQLTTAWGEAILSGGGMTRYGSTQRERDEESDLMYFRARTYDPRLGLFRQPDPARERTGTRRYSYAHNNPTRFTDPTGMYEQDFHYYAVYYLGWAAGLSPDDTYSVAAAGCTVTLPATPPFPLPAASTPPILPPGTRVKARGGLLKSMRQALARHGVRLMTRRAQVADEFSGQVFVDLELHSPPVGSKLSSCASSAA